MIQLLLEQHVVRQRMRARPDDGHLALQDVDQLRQLIKARAAQEPSNARHSRVVALGLLNFLAVFGNGHGSELEDPEDRVVLAVPALTEEDRSRAVELDRQSDQREQRRQKRERYSSDDKIDHRLQQPVALGERDQIDDTRSEFAERASALNRDREGIEIRAQQKIGRERCEFANAFVYAGAFGCGKANDDRVELARPSGGSR